MRPWTASVDFCPTDFVSEFFEDALNLALLPGLAALCETIFDTGWECQGPKLRPVIAHDAAGFSVGEEQPFVLPQHFECLKI